MNQKEAIRRKIENRFPVGHAARIIAEMDREEEYHAQWWNHQRRQRTGHKNK